MSLFVAFVILVGMGILIWQHQVRQPEKLKRIYWLALAIKILAGISVGLLYSYYYTAGDTFGYFNDAVELNKLIHIDLGVYVKFLLFSDNSSGILEQLSNVQARSLFLVKTVSLVSILSSENYWLTSMYFSLTSFLGSWFIIKRVAHSFPHATRAALLSFALFPSVVFWSSGITKESLAMASLTFLAGLLVMVMEREKLGIWNYLLLLISIYVLWSLKYYWAAIFIPSALTGVLIKRLIIPKFPALKPELNIVAWLGTFTILCLVVSRLHPNFYAERFLNVMVSNYQAYQPLPEGKAAVHFMNLERSWLSLIINSPWALFSGLYRPFIFESKSIFQALASIENLLLLVLTIYNIKNLRSAWRSPDQVFIFSLLVFIVLLAIFLSLSTPNLGTLSRYRIAILPFFSFLLLVKAVQPLRAFQNLDHP